MTTDVTELRDRRASSAELRKARRYVLDVDDGIGIKEAARRLGRSTGFVSDALKGKTPTPLMLSDLRKLRVTPEVAT